MHAAQLYFFHEKTMQFLHGSLGVIFYEQRGWEKFSHPNKRGKCLHVINLTSVLYHEVKEQSNKFVFLFTILSKSSHDTLDNRIK